jgi:hypothetical protein
VDWGFGSSELSGWVHYWTDFAPTTASTTILHHGSRYP